MRFVDELKPFDLQKAKAALARDLFQAFCLRVMPPGADVKAVLAWVDRQHAAGISRSVSIPYPAPSWQEWADVAKEKLSAGLPLVEAEGDLDLARLRVN